MRGSALAALLLLMDLAAAPGAAAQTDTLSARRTLQGVEGMMVVVEQTWPLASEARGGAISTSTLQTEVEARARQAGIPIIEGAVFEVSHHALLYLRVGVLEVRVDSQEPALAYAYAVNLGVTQRVFLQRNGSPTAATTWGAAWLGVSPHADLVKNVRAAVHDKVDEFISAYLAANPKAR